MDGGFYRKASTNKWWDGYKGEQNILIDEFDGQIGITHLLQWFDPYEMTVECKGGGVALHGVHWIITSNNPPTAWYATAGKRHVDALLRRFCEIKEFNTPYRP